MAKVPKGLTIAKVEMIRQIIHANIKGMLEGASESTGLEWNIEGGSVIINGEVESDLEVSVMLDGDYELESSELDEEGVEKVAAQRSPQTSVFP